MFGTGLFRSSLLILILVTFNGNATAPHTSTHTENTETQANIDTEYHVVSAQNILVEWKNISQTESQHNSYFRNHSGFNDVSNTKWRRKFVKGKWRWLRWNGINWQYQRVNAPRSWRDGRGAWRWRRKLVGSHYEMLKWKNGQWNRQIFKADSNNTLTWAPWEKEEWRRQRENGKMVWQRQVNGQWIRQRLQRDRWRWRQVLKDGESVWVRWDDDQSWRVSKTNEKWRSSNTWKWRRVIYLGENRWVKWRENAWYLVQWNGSGRQSYMLWPTKWIWKPFNDTDGHVMWKRKMVNSTSSKDWHLINLYNGNSWRYRQVLDREERKIWLFWRQGKWMYRDMEDGKQWKVWKSSESWQWRRKLVNNHWCWFKWLNYKWVMQNSENCNSTDNVLSEKWMRFHRGQQWFWKKFSVKSRKWHEMPSAQEKWRYRKMMINGRWRWLWFSRGLWHINDKIEVQELTDQESKPLFSVRKSYVYRVWKPQEAWRWQKVFNKDKYLWLKWGEHQMWWYLKKKVWLPFSSEKWQRIKVDNVWKWHVLIDGKWQKRPLLCNAWRWRLVLFRSLSKVEWKRVVWRDGYWWHKVKIGTKILYRKWKPANRWRWKLKYMDNTWQWLYWKSNRWMMKIKNGDSEKLVELKDNSRLKRVKIHKVWQWRQLIKGQYRRVRLAGGSWRWRRSILNGRSVWLCWRHGKWQYKDEGGRHRWITWHGESVWRWHKFWIDYNWQMFYWWYGKWWKVNIAGDLVLAAKQDVRWKIGRLGKKRVFIQRVGNKLKIKSFKENNDLWRKKVLDSGTNVWLKWRRNLWFTRHSIDRFSTQLDSLASDDMWKWRRTFSKGRYVWLYWKNDRWWQEQLVYENGKPLSDQWKVYDGHKWKRLKVNNQWRWHYFDGKKWQQRPLHHAAWLWRRYSSISKGKLDEKWLMWRKGCWQYRMNNTTGHLIWKKWKPFNKWRWRKKFVNNKWTWIRWDNQQWMIQTKNGTKAVPTAKYRRVLQDKKWAWHRYDEFDKQWHEVRLSGGLWRWRQVIVQGKKIWLNWKKYQWNVKDNQNQWKVWKSEENWRWRQRWSGNRWEIVFWKNNTWWQRSSAASDWSVAMSNIWKHVRVGNQWKWLKLQNNRWLVTSFKEISPNWRISVFKGNIVWLKWLRGKWWRENKVPSNHPRYKRQYEIWKQDEAWRWQSVVKNGTWIFLKWGPLNRWWYQANKHYNAKWILWSTEEWKRIFENNHWQWFRLEGKIWKPHIPPGEVWKKRIVLITSHDGKNHSFAVHFRDGYWRYKIYDNNEVKWLIWKKSEIWQWRVKYLNGFFVWLRWHNNKWIINDEKIAKLLNGTEVSSPYRRIKVRHRWQWYRVDKHGKLQWIRLKGGEWRWRQEKWRNHTVWLKWEHKKWWRNVIVEGKSIWFSWKPHENWRWRRVWINDRWKMVRFSNSYWWYQISNATNVTWIKQSSEPWKRQLSEGKWIWLRFVEGRWQQTDLMEWSSRWRSTQFKSKPLWLRWFHGFWWRKTQKSKPTRNVWKSWKFGKWRHVFNNSSWQWLRFKYGVWNVHHLKGGQWRWRLTNFKNNPQWLVWRNGNWWRQIKIESKKFVWNLWKPESSWKWRVKWIDGNRHWIHWKDGSWWIQSHINGRLEWKRLQSQLRWKQEWKKGHWRWFQWKNKQWQRKHLQGGSWRWRWTLKDGKRMWLKWQNNQWNQRINMNGKWQWKAWNKQRAWLWRRVWFTQRWRWLLWRQGQWYLLNQDDLKNKYSVWNGKAWRRVYIKGEWIWQKHDNDGHWSNTKSLNEDWRWRTTFINSNRNRVQVRWQNGKWLAQSWRQGLRRWHSWQSGAWRRQLLNGQWIWQRLISNKWTNVQILHGRSWRRWRTVVNPDKNVVWLQFWRGKWRERFLKDKLWQWRPWHSRFNWRYSWVNGTWRLLRWRNKNWEWFNQRIGKWIVWQAGEWRRVSTDGKNFVWMHRINGQWIEQRLSWRWYRTQASVWLHWHNQQWWSQQKLGTGKIVWMAVTDREGWRWQYRFIFGQWHWLKWHLGQWRYRIRDTKNVNRWKWLVWKRGFWRRTFIKGSWIWQELHGKRWQQVHLRGGIWRWRQEKINGRMQWLRWKHDKWWIQVTHGNKSVWKVHGSEHWRWFRFWMKSQWVWMHWNGGRWLYQSRNHGHWIWKTWRRSSKERWKSITVTNNLNSSVNGGVVRVYKKRLYYFSTSSITWLKANDLCQALWHGRGRLVKISNIKENKFLQRFIDSAWIGIHYVNKSNIWSWGKDTVKTTNYTNWSFGEPFHPSNTKPCSILTTNGTWNSTSCLKTHRYICEKIYGSSEPKERHCPREFTLHETFKEESCKRLRNSPSVIECKSNDNCSSAEMCCFNGCFRECMGPGRLVNHVCFDFQRNRFLPGDDFQLGCHMCTCNVYGQATNCRQLMPCSPKSVLQQLHSNELKKLNQSMTEEKKLLTETPKSTNQTVTKKLTVMIKELDRTKISKQIN